MCDDAITLRRTWYVEIWKIKSLNRDLQNAKMNPNGNFRTGNYIITDEISPWVNSTSEQKRHEGTNQKAGR